MLLPDIAYPPQQGPLEPPNKSVLRTAGGDTYELMATHGPRPRLQHTQGHWSLAEGVGAQSQIWGVR